MNAHTPQTTQVASVRRTTKPQPLQAAELDDALLTLRTASATAGLSQATLYRLAAAGRLQMVKIGNRCTRIRASELRRFMASLG